MPSPRGDAASQAKSGQKPARSGAGGLWGESGREGGREGGRDSGGGGARDGRTEGERDRRGEVERGKGGEEKIPPPRMEQSRAPPVGVGAYLGGGGGGNHRSGGGAARDVPAPPPDVGEGGRLEEDHDAEGEEEEGGGENVRKYLEETMRLATPRRNRPPTPEGMFLFTKTNQNVANRN